MGAVNLSCSCKLSGEVGALLLVLTVTSVLALSSPEVALNLPKYWTWTLPASLLQFMSRVLEVVASYRRSYLLFTFSDAIFLLVCSLPSIVVNVWWHSASKTAEPQERPSPPCSLGLGQVHPPTKVPCAPKPLL